MTKPISQREARRLRKQVQELFQENSQLRMVADTVVEKIPLDRFANTGTRLQDAINTARTLKFRVEVAMENDVLCLTAVRRRPMA